MTNEGMKDFFPEEQRAAPIISAVKSVSEQTGGSMAQVALAWLRHQTVPVIPDHGERGRYLNSRTISPVWIWNSPPNS